MKRFLLLLCLFNSLFAMTLEEKIGQLLIVNFYGESVNDEARTLIHQAHVGGFIYYTWANGLKSPAQVKALSEGLQQEASIPLLITIDQEGGLVTRLKEGFTCFPGNAALGATNDPLLAEEAAYAMGKELKAVGINLNLAPVVDIHSNSKNPIIGIRSFGATAKQVTLFASHTLKGYHKAGLLTSLKHFPGHGDVESDPHEDLPLIHKTYHQLWMAELLPFLDLCPLADTIMTGHILLPLIDPTHCTTLSKELIHNILQNQIGFKGVVISDSLVMEGFLKNCNSIEEGAMMALNAGCDILLLGGKQLFGEGKEAGLLRVLEIHKSLVQAVKEGKISEERVNQAVKKVLALKEKITPPHALFDPIHHQELAKKIAEKALQVVQKSSRPLCAKKVLLIAPDFYQHSASADFYFSVGGPIANKEEITKASAHADAVIFFSYNAWKNPKQVDLFHSLKGKRVVISLCDSIDAELFKNADVVVTTSSPSIVSLQAALRLVEAYL